jgi:hypothetical protein
LKTGHKNDTMSMLHKKSKCIEAFVSENRKQGFFRNNNKHVKYPILRYKQSPALNNLDKAFDLLFEEMVKNNIL